MKRPTELSKAERVAARVVATLSPFVERIEVAGSVRRRKPIVGDVDLAIAEPHTGFAEAFASIGGRLTRASGTAEVDGVTVEISVFEDGWELIWGAVLCHMTGSAEENKRLRVIAKRNGWRLSQYGLRDVGTGELLAGRSEEEIYEALGERYVPVEDR